MAIMIATASSATLPVTTDAAGSDSSDGSARDAFAGVLAGIPASGGRGSSADQAAKPLPKAEPATEAALRPRHRAASPAATGAPRSASSLAASR